MLSQLIRARVTQSALAIVVTYWVVAALVPSQILLEILDGTLLAVAVLVLAVYLPLAAAEMFKDRLDRSGRLLVGIALAWSCTIILRFLAVYGRAFGRLAWFIESPFFSFVLWGMIWAGALHISAPYADDPTRRLPYGKWILFVVLMGGLIAGFFLGVQSGTWFGQGAVVKPMTG